MTESTGGLSAEFVKAIDEIPADLWNSLCGTDYPFLRHEYLQALESSGAVSLQTGWVPQHLLIKQQKRLLACMPLYQKFHSFGEFVFDQGWAQALERIGVSYYPKLLTAIPFTPETGPRLGFAEAAEPATLISAITGAVTQLCRHSECSSWHLLFGNRQCQSLLKAEPLLQREDVHFCWYNRDYSDFNRFLATLNARKRKSIRKERQRVAEQGFVFRTVAGENISDGDWDFFYRCYQQTNLRYSGHGGYLPRAFFVSVGKTLPKHLLMFIAEVEGRPLAAVLCFRSAKNLYGRYWGSLVDADCLHFEACYYQGIEYCIANGLSRFQPGVGGEYKVSRGFLPFITQSWHWLKHPGLSTAVADFLVEEKKHIARYKEQIGNFRPYRKDLQLPTPE